MHSVIIGRDRGPACQAIALASVPHDHVHNKQMRMFDGARTPTPTQQSNTDQQMSFRNL